MYRLQDQLPREQQDHAMAIGDEERVLFLTK
jgi:hypothetical protein